MISLDESIPSMDSGSGVTPITRCNSSELYLAYYRGSEESSAVLRFDGLRDWHYGYPNDEALDSHPLYGHGLEFYAFHVTPAGQFGDRAWIATFHDGTFTVYAKQVEVLSQSYAGSPGEAINAIVGSGSNKVLDNY